MSTPAPKPQGNEDRPRRRSVAVFKVGDIVGSPAREGWVGEVVDISRLGNGFVTVRWRTPSGISLQSMEERVDFLVVVPPIKGGAAVVGERRGLLRRERAVQRDT
jgi:hypothetical protein